MRPKVPSIGADARLDALARMFALFPDEPAIVVVDRSGARIGVVTPDRAQAHAGPGRLICSGGAGMSR